MPDATCFECFDVRSRDVLAVADEPSKQNAYMTGFERHTRPGTSPLRHRPAAAPDEPLDVGADGIRQRGFNGPGRDELLRVGFRNWERDDGWLLWVVLSGLLERHVVRLQAVRVAVHQRQKCRVDGVLDVGHAPEALAQLDACGACC